MLPTGYAQDFAVRVGALVDRLAFMQNLRRAHYDLATEPNGRLRRAAAFIELATAI